MPKEFFTERDIEDMVKRGILSLEINDNVVLTDLAYERASRLGMKLVRDKPENPPAAPVRPYLSQQGQTSPRPAPAMGPPPSMPLAAPRAPAFPGALVPPPQADGSELHQRIRSAVIARLGTQVDANLLDVIIARVIQNTGIK